MVHLTFSAPDLAIDRRCGRVPYHPELKSRPFAPHPLLASFVMPQRARASPRESSAPFRRIHRKPNGQYVITPEMGPTFVEGLPVGKFHGIGPATSAKMNALGIYSGLDMRNQSIEFMQANLGKAGPFYYWISRGVDNREVRANRLRKSVGAENTFSTDLSEFDQLFAELQPLIEKVWRYCQDKGSRGRTVTLKVKFNDFEIITRSRSVPVAISSRSDLESLAVALLQSEMPVSKPVRLLGVSLSLLHGDVQVESQLGLPL